MDKKLHDDIIAYCKTLPKASKNNKNCWNVANHLNNKFEGDCLFIKSNSSSNTSSSFNLSIRIPKKMNKDIINEYNYHAVFVKDNLVYDIIFDNIGINIDEYLNLLTELSGELRSDTYLSTNNFGLYRRGHILTTYFANKNDPEQNNKLYIEKCKPKNFNYIGDDIQIIQESYKLSTSNKEVRYASLDEKDSLLLHNLNIFKTLYDKVLPSKSMRLKMNITDDVIKEVKEGLLKEVFKLYNGDESKEDFEKTLRESLVLDINFETKELEPNNFKSFDEVNQTKLKENLILLANNLVNNTSKEISRKLLENYKGWIIEISPIELNDIIQGVIIPKNMNTSKNSQILRSHIVYINEELKTVFDPIYKNLDIPYERYIDEVQRVSGKCIFKILDFKLENKNVNIENIDSKDSNNVVIKRKTKLSRKQRKLK